MTLITAGIDDLGTEKQLLEGWSYFVIENDLLEEFSHNANELLSGIALGSFHGKNYKRRFKEKYLAFLKLCREYSEKSKISLIGVVLQNEQWKNKYRPFTERLVANAYGQNNIIDPEFVSAAQMLAGPLFTLQNSTKALSSDYIIQIIVDSHTVTENFGKQTIQVSNQLGSAIMSANQLLGAIYNVYRNQLFPNSPVLVEKGISVQPDSNSFLIQAADIMGNFCLSYVKKKLGAESNTINEKAQIFSEVFGDKFDKLDFTKDFKLSETGEIDLTYDGQQTLKFGRYEL